MLENKELKYILTNESGKMIAGYSNLKDAETDADDICKSKKNKKFNVYLLKNSIDITDTVIQKTFELHTSYPLPEPEPEPEKEDEKKEKVEEKDKKEKESKKD